MKQHVPSDLENKLNSMKRSEQIDFFESLGFDMTYEKKAHDSRIVSRKSSPKTEIQKSYYKVKST